MKKYKLTIRIAGNTEAPVLSVIKGKGYKMEYYVYFDEDTNDYSYFYNAEKDGRRFSASNAEELLGLIAMWEVRGDDWRGKKDDFELLDYIHDAGILYDTDGNIIRKYKKQ